MDPISNQVFSHDSVKYVYQDPDVRMINQGLPPSKPFDPKAVKKTKKDLKKNKEQGEYKHPLSGT